MSPLPRPVYLISSSLSIASGVLILFVAGLTVADVIQRSVFGKSILGTMEISTLVLVAIAFLGLASAEIDGRHVSVNLLESTLRPSIRQVLCVIRLLLILGIGATLVWGLVHSLTASIARSETTNGILKISIWPAKLTLLTSFSLYFFVAAFKSYNEFNFLRLQKVKE